MVRPCLRLLPLAVLAACAGEPNLDTARRRAIEGDGDIVVGAAWPWASRSEIRYWEGMQLALEEVNADGGVRGRAVRIRKADDNADIDEGRLVAQRFASDPEVVAVIGHLQSYVTIAAAAIYDLAGLVLIAPTASAPALTGRGYGRVFRITFNDWDAGRSMAEFALRQGYSRVVIYYSRDEYGRGLANAFEERIVEGDARVLDRRSYSPDDTSNPHSAIAAAEAWSTLRPDAVFIAGEDAPAAMLVRELRRAGSESPILAGDAVATRAFLRTGGAAAGGTVVATPFHPESPSPVSRRFVSAFRQRYGEVPDVGAALGYDALRVLVTAMRRAPSSAPVDVAAALRALQDVDGVTGALRFDTTGERREAPVYRIVAWAGRFRYLDERVPIEEEGR